MTANQQSNEGPTVKHRHRVEGPEKHIVVFIFSIVLTAIAFAAVAAGGINTAFT
ncbi:cytochrome C oxidase subunit IV, partial [Clostridium perfringens]